MQVGRGEYTQKASVGRCFLEVIGDKHLSFNALTLQIRKPGERAVAITDLTASKVICSRFENKSTSFDLWSGFSQLYRILPHIKERSPMRSPINHAHVSTNVFEARQEAKIAAKLLTAEDD